MASFNDSGVKLSDMARGGHTCKSVYFCIYLHQCVYSMYIYTQCTQPRFLVLLSHCTALLTVPCFIDTAEIQL